MLTRYEEVEEERGGEMEKLEQMEEENNLFALPCEMKLNKISNFQLVTGQLVNWSTRPRYNQLVPDTIPKAQSMSTIGSSRGSCNINTTALATSNIQLIQFLETGHHFWSKKLHQGDLNIYLGKVKKNWGMLCIDFLRYLTIFGGGGKSAHT